MLVKVLLKGYNLTRACNGREAVELAGREEVRCYPDGYPDAGDGRREATRRIREFCPAIPIIAVTANAFDEDRRRAFEAGVDDFPDQTAQQSQIIRDNQPVLTGHGLKAPLSDGMRICVCYPMCSGMNMPDPTIICRKIGFGCEKCLNLHFRLRIVKSNSK
ncbi:MAG: response regulator [Alistipes indistinctus]